MLVLVIVEVTGTTMNRQLTVVLVAVLTVAAVGGGAVLFTGQHAGGDDRAAAADASAAVEEATATARASDSNERVTATGTETPTPTETASTSTPEPTENASAGGDASDGPTDENASSDDPEAGSVERANEPPTAEAGANRTVLEWVRVHFDGTASTDPDGDDANLTYQWTQVGGPELDMAHADTSTAYVLAPEVTKPVEYTYMLTVTDEAGATDTDTVTITVRSPELDGHTLEKKTETEDNATENGTDDGERTPNPDDGAGDSGGSDAGDGDSGGSDAGDGDASAETSRDDIAQSVYGEDFDVLGPEEAATVEEFYMRQPDGDWDLSSVKTRDELAREKYDKEFDRLGFDARVDVQETFDAQFGDTGGELTKDEISKAKWWGYAFEDLSNESAGQITEMYDRQPWDLDRKHVPTREQLAFRFYDADLDELTREQRLHVERRYNNYYLD